ncbi:MAG: ABC transporter ATP-binding protein [Inconstantimicrobium porci]|uniref:ABC transporter ATP-binding protein n=1 Tax=Inconstantimicrobium porci TaxID=2652291 RepID=UPI002A91E751|nr:ABC transporter ATP-binding protein [Inconstantimicrobium porci]MDY5910465.1 ABC transporter ATP-binding protein [Inconstantimicrobium porci]
MNAISLKNITKKFDGNIVVDNINLNIEQGEIYGFLGPNGAGKSTTISMICSLIHPTDGDIEIMGTNIKKDSREIKKKIGLVPQNIALYKDFTAYENIKFFAELYGLKGDMLKRRINEALEFTGLMDVKDKKAKTYSGGMQRRLNIACALVHKPQIIIMDEPTVGIDPQSRNHIMNAVKKLNEEGTTIIYTTHYMEEAEALCSKIAIIDKGKIIVEGTKEELKNMISDKSTLSVTVDDIYKLDVNQIKGVQGVQDVSVKENTLSITSSKEVSNLDKLINTIESSSAKIIDLGFKDISLETVFLSLTGRNLRD